ncbi:MAG: DUF4271 domain-containing protein [Bacteroidales bacterium]
MKGAKSYTTDFYFYQDTIHTLTPSSETLQEQGQSQVMVDSSGVQTGNEIISSSPEKLITKTDTVPRKVKKTAVQAFQTASPQADASAKEREVKNPVSENITIAWKSNNDFSNFLYHDTTGLMSESYRDSVATIPVIQFEKRQTAFFKERLELNIDWVFWIFIIVAFLFIWIQLFYRKYVVNLFNSVVSFQASSKLYNEKNIVIRRVSLVLNFIFVISISLLLLRISVFYNQIPEEYDKISFFLIVLNILILYMVVKTILVKLVGYIFLQGNLVNDYLHNANIYNKSLGIILIPFLFASFYTNSKVAEILLYIIVLIYFFSLIFKIIRGFQIIIKYDIFIFYSILYLCTLEILPLLVGYKLIKSLY